MLIFFKSRALWFPIETFIFFFATIFLKSTYSVILSSFLQRSYKKVSQFSPKKICSYESSATFIFTILGITKAKYVTHVYAFVRVLWHEMPSFFM